MLGFRDTDSDSIADLEEKVFGAKASKSKLRRKAYKEVLNQLAAIQEANGFSQEEMVAAVAALGSARIPVRLAVSVRTKRGGK